jgi:spore coat protein H
LGTALALWLLLSGDLWDYQITMLPDDLEALYEEPCSGILYPAHVSSPAGECDCLVGFRGTTSLGLPKKSWRIDLEDPGVAGRSRINLDAHYRDLSMMRNHLAMELVRRMGLPAPETRHVTLSINGENMGVYLETERVDEDFLVRNGLPDGSLFKAVEGSARFAAHMSGTGPAIGFEYGTDSEWNIPELDGLIESVCRGEDLRGLFDTELLAGNMAADLAMMEADGPAKNYYLLLGPDGIWRFFPWDHDSSFGNDWQGVFHPEYVDYVHAPQMQFFTPFAVMMRDGGLREEFRAGLLKSADLMAAELVESLDSVRAAIREDVYADPLRQGTPEDFEAACDSLRWFIQRRAGMVADFYFHHSTPDSLRITVTPAWLEPDAGSLLVTALCSDSLHSCSLWLIADGGTPQTLQMSPVPGSRGRGWCLALDPGCFDGNVRFFVEICQATVSWPVPPVFYPHYGIFSGEYCGEALPAAVRVERTPATGDLAPATQLRLGPSLWALPLVNTGGEALNLSLCRVALGDPLRRVFLPESLTLLPGETLFISNRRNALDIELPGRKTAGDCIAATAAGTSLEICDPGWNRVALLSIPAGERNLRPCDDFPVITEISYSQPADHPSGDWLEIYNPGNEPLDLSLARISDSEQGGTVFPQGTVIPPFGFLVMASDPDRFTPLYPELSCDLLDLGFNLSPDGEALDFTCRAGSLRSLLEFSDRSPWPETDEGIIAILSPGLDQSSPSSWVSVDQPGSPGMGNPAWNQENGSRIRLGRLRPNPSRGAVILFDISGGAGPIKASVVDLAGRVVLEPGILEPGAEEYALSLPADLPAGVYFLVVRSAGLASTGKFLWLP